MPFRATARNYVEYVEYVQDHGWFADPPLERILASCGGFRFEDVDVVVDDEFA